jgi:hypothetical protein
MLCRDVGGQGNLETLPNSLVQSEVLAIYAMSPRYLVRMEYRTRQSSIDFIQPFVYLDRLKKRAVSKGIVSASAQEWGACQ